MDQPKKHSCLSLTNSRDASENVARFRPI